MIIEPSAAPLVLPLLDVVRASGGDDVERFFACGVDLGLLDMWACPEGTVRYSLSPKFVEMLGLNDVGIDVENGEWVFIR